MGHILPSLNDADHCKEDDMIKKQTKHLDIPFTAKAIADRIESDYSLFSYKRHARYKAILRDVVKYADKARDWTCYRRQEDIALAVFGSATDSNLRTVKRAFARFYKLGLLEVVGRERMKLEKDGIEVNALGKNYYRVTNVLLNIIGFTRQAALMPLITLQTIWKTVVTALPTRLSRSF
ncbi:hypothetical protein C9J03_25890 [Photobacterium gaetbulicola]|uniref:Uncharacterized protein n=1 Tax=Photobacterium gaetbulicola Gung47 TaxID=658445 RepID=A0A0C5WX63_9GAMM|nr:hypothetical protein [Photobacterium gaetbulicola]AJR09624.1 hypothetical protein H744_2c2973 [Photobacterium gaetbulicola Gung47]PST99177.1 hypothetical protein C9J03_25890 [Photobacterium gaetbulicola]